MDNIDPEVLIDLICNQGLTDKQVSEHLILSTGHESGLSERSVRRWRSENKFLRRESVDDATANALVSGAAFKLGPSAGRRYVKGYLNSQGGPVVGEHRIGEILKDFDPPAHASRVQGVRQQTNPIPYFAEYFGHRLHMDQNEKLAMFGVTHVMAVDGYSGYIVGHLTMPIKNNKLIYGGLFRPAFISYGLWDQLIADMGTEFSLVLAVQNMLSPYRTNTNRVCFLQTFSKRNNRIERPWVEVNERVNYPIKRCLLSMVDTGRLDMTDPVQRFCCSLVSRQVANAGLTRLVEARNHHPVPKRGVPNHLMLGNNRCAPVDPNLVPTADAAVASYIQNGGQITEPHDFGHDPIQSPDLAALRDRALSAFPYSPSEIFSSVVNGEHSLLQDYFDHCLQNTVEIAES